MPGGRHDCRFVSGFRGRLRLDPWHADSPLQAIGRRHRLIMQVLGIVDREEMLPRPVVLGHEEHLVGLDGIEGGPQGAATGVANGAGRKAGEFPGVVRRVRIQVRNQERAGGFAYGEADRGIRSQAPSQLEPIVEDPGDEFLFGGPGGFLPGFLFRWVSLVALCPRR